MTYTHENEPMEVGCRVVPFKADGSPAVLIQLPDGFIVLRPHDARRLAAAILNTADEADESE